MILKTTPPFLIMCLLLFGPFFGYAQELQSPVLELVADAHALEPAFQPVSLLSLVPQNKRKTDKNTDEVLLTYEELALTPDGFDLKKAPQTMQLFVPGGQFGDFQLDLVKAQVLTEDFTLITDASDGKGLVYSGIAHYRGTVAGDAHSLVALSVMDGEVMGAISSAKGTFTLGKLQDGDRSSGRHMLYRDSDLLVESGSTCGVKTQPLSAKDQVLMALIANGDAGQRSKSTNCVRVFLELDHSLVIEKGGVAGAMNWMEAVWNQVATLYQNENITTQLSQVMAWTSPDPYNAVNTSTALSIFQSTRTSFNGDLAHLISRGAPSGGGVAYLNALCTNRNYAYSYVYNSYANVPTYSWTVNVITHEMGHNLGSYHTHDCVWNGNNTAIDGCGPAAGYPGLGSCTAAPLPPSGGGTIMSYCHLVGNVGIGLANGFGPQPGALLRAKVDAAGCLTGCTAPDCFLVGMTSTPSACNSSSGTAMATVTGGTAPLIYNWSNGATTATATGLAPGNHAVTITDGTSCSEVHFVNIGGSPTPTLDMDGWAAAGSANGRARARASGGTPPYTYAWNTGATNNDLMNLVAGTYTVTVTDNIGCTAVDNFVVTDGATGCTSGTVMRLTIQADQSPSDTYWELYDEFGTPIVSEFFSQLGVTAGGLYSYVFCLPEGCYALAVWDGQSNGLCNPNSNPPGYFELEDITNGGIIHAGCDYGAVYTQAFCTGNRSLLAMSSTDISCAGGADGTATVSDVYSQAALSYAWSNGGTTPTISGLTAGTYSVTVTNSIYLETASITITAPAVLALNTSSNNPTLGNNGDASIAPSGGTAPYAYLWNNSATTSTITGLLPGTYSVTVTDANGCTESAVITLTDDTPPVTATALITQVSCNGGSDGAITVTPSGGAGVYTYQWSNNATTQTVTGLPAGTYQVAVISTSNFVVETIVVTEPPVLMLSVSSADATSGQNNGTANVAASGGTPGYTYAWSNGGTTPGISGLAPGTYSVTVTDANSCPATAGVVIVNAGSPLTLNMTSTNISCKNADDGTAFVAAAGGTGAYQYAWSTGATTPGITSLAPGNYAVTVTSGTVAVSSSVTITEPTRVNPAASSLSASNGMNGSAYATCSGGVPPYTFAWSNGATTANIFGLAPGSYTVTATDATGCTGDITVVVNDITPAVTLTTSSTDVTCNGDTDGSATVTASGGTGIYAYLWNNGATTATVGSLAPGTYIVTVTSFSRTATASIIIGEPAAVQVTVFSNDSAQGQATGNATATPSAGVGPYTYLWSSGSTFLSATGLAPGTYTVTVTDANGCTAIGSATIGEYTPGLELLESSTDATCNGGSDGTANVQAFGGVGNYTYQWSNGATTATISGLAAGSYFVTVTSGSQTTVGGTIVNEPTAIVLNGTVTDASNGANGSVTVNPSGGTVPYTYLWNIGNQTTATINDLPQGFYTCTVTDANGCTANQQFTVNSTTPACNDEEFFFRIQLDDHPGETTWELKDGNGQTVASGGPYVVDFMYLEYSLCLPAGCYDLTVFDAGGNGLGSGYYEITKNSSLVLNGGQFGASETQNFCIGATPQIVFERGRISTTGDGWQTVQLSNQYTNPVVIATPVITSTSLDPVVARVRNAGANSFQIRAQRPGANTNDTYDIEYFVVEEGVYDFPTYGVKMEAVLTTSTRTAARSRWGSNYRENRSYQNAYLNPVVLGQVMSQNDADFSVFWASRSNSQSNAPTPSSFAAGKHVAEDNDRTRSNESLGYVVIEAGSGTINGEEYVTGVGSDIVKGQQNSSLGYLYNVPNNLYLLGGVLSSAAMDGNDGGWPVFKADPIGAGGFRLAIEEDQIRDNERSHTSEQAAYLLFGLALSSTDESPQGPKEEVSVTAPTLALPEISATAEIKIFPNPTSDRLNVVYQAAEGTSVQLTVWDLRGRKIMEQSAQGTVQTTFDVSSLKAGLYLLDLRSGSDRQTKRFIVN
ncbi:T9SS type A sorting domain-containing protein [Neolewinella persica]|uniref:T9SS type A sorting domain-containing protein n=1 Tax=Neolewinella persica TaxID=70998 RepID=UPI000A065F93|nr:T9SS type A sorting domain-containing protein [Neolewinella persica]